MKLRPDLVLVELPPVKPERKVDLITTDLDTFLVTKGIEEFQRLVKHGPVERPIGRVVQVGTQTQDVWPGDVVLLEPEAGQDVDIRDEAGRPHPHVIVRERDIQAVIERTEA